MNTDIWQLERTNENQCCQLVLSDLKLCAVISSILSYKQYIIVIGGSPCSEKVTILDISAPGQAYVVKSIPLSKCYAGYYCSLITKIDDNQIEILVFGGCSYKLKVSDSFSQILINFNTFTYSINDKPQIQTHFAAAKHICDNICKNKPCSICGTNHDI